MWQVSEGTAFGRPWPRRSWTKGGPALVDVGDRTENARFRTVMVPDTDGNYIDFAQVLIGNSRARMGVRSDANAGFRREATRTEQGSARSLKRSHQSRHR